jgi:predicted nucleic acid-binding protein
VQFLLDTTALSELTRARPNAGFLQWISENSAEETFIGAPSIGELEVGITLLDQSKKRRSLEAWLQRLIADFGHRILPFDVSAARIWGRAVGAARRKGVSLPATDSQIAAIASVRGLAVVTRNVRHFEVAAFSDLVIVNPWS